VSYKSISCGNHWACLHYTSNYITFLWETHCHGYDVTVTMHLCTKHNHGYSGCYVAGVNLYVEIEGSKLVEQAKLHLVLCANASTCHK
jgi:hypothetical protein